LLALFLVESARRAARSYAGQIPGTLLDLAAERSLPLAPSCFIVFVGAALGCVSAWFAVREARDVQS
jgi:hypothetical protein